MKIKKYLPDIVFTAIALSAGAVSSLFVSQGMAAYKSLEKPPFAPAEFLFPIIWNIIYILMGLGMGDVWRSKTPFRKTSCAVFFCRLAVNFLWPHFFFAKGMYFFSALWLFLLICLVIIMIISFSLSSKKAAWLQVPYLVWSLFAIALNCAIAFLN